MKQVRATAHGFYQGSLRQPGDVFSVADGAKGKWFEEVAPAVSDAKPGSEPKPVRQPRVKPAPVAEEGAGDLV